MTGYLMNFFKYAAIDADFFEKDDQMYLNALGGDTFVRSVVWSVFDRIEIRPIEQFQDFRLSQVSEKKWIGERQFSLLYELNSKDPHIAYEKNQDRCLFCFHKVYKERISLEERLKKEEGYRFFGISMIDLTPELHNDFFQRAEPGNAMYQAMRELIDELCEKNGIGEDKLCYELFGTLGGNDLVIIWLANGFRDVVVVLEALRMTQIKRVNKSIFANVATIMGLRDINNKNINYEDVEGQLNIRFTKKGTYDHKVFEEAVRSFLNNEDITFETILGEHDLALKIPGIELTKRIYNENGFIHIKNQDFLDNIIQANTELSVEIDYDSIITGEFKLEKWNQPQIISLKEKEDVYKNIEEITNNIFFDELPYLKETLWILYEDYLRNISSSFSYPWILDLHYQFKASMEYLKELVKDETCLSRDMKFRCINDLTSIIRQATLHVAQANRLFFEIPNTHLKNTGNYSKILRTYYGIVKQLLKQAYSIPKSGSQAIIVPFITFDVTPIIKSSMLPQLGGTEYVIVNIMLPYEALVDIPKYAKLLAHEVYHYIAPPDRVARNIEIGVLCVSLFISLLLMRFLDEIVDSALGDESKKISLNFYKDLINEKCLRYVVSNYKCLMTYVEDYNEDDEWEEYFAKLEKVFSVKSTKFPGLQEVHRMIYKIFAELIDEAIKDTILKGLKDNELDKLRKAFQNVSQNEFEDWLTKKEKGRPNTLIKEIKYALREIAPDYFMLQVMKEEERIKSYYQMILYYRKLLIREENNIIQLYRVGIMTDYLFSDITSNLGSKSTKKVIGELEKTLQEKAGVLEEDKQYIIKCFIGYYETFKQYRGLIFLYISNMDFELFQRADFEEILKETRGLLDDKAADDFHKSVQYVERFQVQKSLKEVCIHRNAYNNSRDNNVIQNIGKELGIKLEESILEEKTGLYAGDISSLINRIDQAAKEITDGIEPIWYRGHSSYKYRLLPTLYRMKDGKRYFYNGITLRDIMEPLFKSFKVRAFGAKEIFDRGDVSRIGLLVSMQHYSVPTNIMDWTASAFTALYFAVEKYMVYSENERKKRENPEVDAEIWILNPIRLNKARAVLISRKMDSGVMWEYPIPSIYEDEEEYQEYIPFSKKNQPDNTPIAVYVPHVNQRIKAQLGMFTMFSLDSKGKKAEDGEGVWFEDLADYQEKYKTMVREEEYKPFLINVRISKNCLHEIADWLRRMGISKPNVYPELTNISKSLTEEIRDYWERKEKE